MKLQILSDTHCEANTFKFQRDPSAEVIVLAGDICDKISTFPAMPTDIPIVYVTGNHEYYGDSIDNYDRVMRDYYNHAYPNLTFCSDVVSKVIGDVGFIGATLWSDLKSVYPADETFERSIADFHYIKGKTTEKLTAQEMRERHESQLFLIKIHANELREKGIKKIVVVTHFPPSNKAAHPKYKNNPLNAYFCPNVDEATIREIGAKVWIYGHTHHTIPFYYGNTYFFSNPRGYLNFKGEVENSDYSDNMIINV